MSGSVSSAAHAERVEEWGPINAMLTEFTSEGAVGSAVARRALRGHWSVEGDASARPADATDSVRTCSSSPRAISRCSTYRAIPVGSPSNELTELHPDLVAGLAQHPGIGFVVVETDTRGPVVVGAPDCAYCRTGTVEGQDPLARYGEQIAADLLEHSRRDHVGDIVVCSLLEEGTDEVAAFEELVGCHGGAGGAQTRAVLLHPAAWSPPDGELTSSNQVHRQLVHWLEKYGQRTPRR